MNNYVAKPLKTTEVTEEFVMRIVRTDINDIKTCKYIFTYVEIPGTIVSFERGASRHLWGKFKEGQKTVHVIAWRNKNSNEIQIGKIME